MATEPQTLNAFETALCRYATLNAERVSFGGVSGYFNVHSGIERDVLALHYQASDDDAMGTYHLLRFGVPGKEHLFLFWLTERIEADVVYIGPVHLFRSSDHLVRHAFQLILAFNSAKRDHGGYIVNQCQEYPTADGGTDVTDWDEMKPAPHYVYVHSLLRTGWVDVALLLEPPASKKVIDELNVRSCTLTAVEAYVRGL